MRTRGLVILVGLLAIVVGALQILIRQRMETFSRNVMSGDWIYVLAGVSISIGCILVWAGALKLVRLFRLVLVLGIVSLASALFVVAAPVFARDVANSFFFYRGTTYRVLFMWTGGILRIIVGLLLIYAGLRPPSPRTPRLGSIVPLA